MPKRIILCLLALCMVLVLSCCGHSEQNTLDTLYSISKAFLNVHYSANVSEAKEFEKLQDEIENRTKSLASPSPGVMGLKDFAPDLSERFDTLIKQKYQTQPVTDKCLKSIEAYGLCTTLWKDTLSTGSDIKVTSVETSLRNKDLDDKENDIDYTVDLVIGKASYEVTGTVVLVIVDGKWMIDGDLLSGWNPPLQG